MNDKEKEQQNNEELTQPKSTKGKKREPVKMVVVNHYAEKGRTFDDIALDLMMSEYNRRLEAERKKKDKETKE